MNEKETGKEIENNQKIKNKHNLLNLKKEWIIAMIPAILNILLNYGICNYYFLSTIDLVTTCFSFIIMYLIYLLITIFMKKTYRTTYLIAIFIFIISIINNIKLYYTNSPIYLSDLFLLGNIREITGIVKHDIIYHIDYVQLGILFILLFLTCIISRKYSFSFLDVKKRVISAITIIAIFLLMLIPIQAKDQFILKYLYQISERKDYKAIATGEDYYRTYGVLAGMYGLVLENRKMEPEFYNEEEVIQTLENVTKSTGKYQKPNIIVMFQESYWNIENIEEVEFDKNLTQNIENLKEKGNNVKLLSASYGGMSSNIEFELLTGGNLAYFPTGYNPFLQLYRTKDAENKPSIIKELNRNGYYTKVTFGKDYYLSENTYKKLGIKEYENAYLDWEDYDEKVKGTYISDEALVDDVIDTLKNKREDEKLFYMVATIQTHMPFKKEVYEKYDINITKSKLNEEETDIILSYAQGIYDTNIQIKRLYDEIQKMEEPIILVFLGDHLPYLYNKEGEDILAKLSYFNTEDEKLNLLRKYTTEALILSNFNMEVGFETEYISPDMLLSILVNKIDMDISPYYSWLYEIRNILPAQNQYITIDREGKVYYTNEKLSENMQKTRILRENIQHYLFEKS